MAFTIIVGTVRLPGPNNPCDRSMDEATDAWRLSQLDVY
jgi:hypothetical protein